MFETRIREIRQRANWSRAMLADHARIGIPEMQRIELGIQPACLEAADRMCDALDTTVSDLFPAAKSIIKRLGDPFQTYNLDDRTIELLAKAGLDVEAAPNSLHVHLRDESSFDFVLSGPERRRVWSVLENTTKPFVVFDAGRDRIALAVPQVKAWSFRRPARYQDTESPDLSILLVDHKETLVFEVPADTASILDDPEDQAAQLQDIFYYLDSGHAPLIAFVDEVATEVFVRSGDIALVRIPLELVEPSMRMDAGD